MSEFDVRIQQCAKPTVIRFSENLVSGTQVASTIVGNDLLCNRIEIRDESYDINTGEGYVIIHDKQHAEMLKLALDKAIELNWLD